MDWREKQAGMDCLTALDFSPNQGLDLLRDLVESIYQKDCLAALRLYNRFYRCLNEGGWHSLGEWLWDQLRDNETPYGRMCQRGERDESLAAAARWECEFLRGLCELPGSEWKQGVGKLLSAQYMELVDRMPEWPAGAPFTFEGLTEAYTADGCGSFARCRAFLWSGGELIAVPDPDQPGEEEMIGYDRQRQMVRENTAALLAGKQVNNVLLYGPGGTGKSATVKSMLSVPGFDRLRLIEVEKQGLADLPVLIRSLAGSHYPFILFIDDLCFDQDDQTYSALKTILEGGLEKRPGNVAIYATSNRRHLVRQTFSDRAGDEVDAAETVSEKTALAERFGLRVLYLPLNKTEYLTMVDQMARRYGVSMDREELHKKAVQWERMHHGCTPRTARQFIASL